MRSLKRKGQIGGLAISAAFAAALCVGAIGISQIRMGGPLYQSVKEVSDLNADILPPAQFIVEPNLEATLLAEDLRTLPARASKLKALQAAYDESAKRWRKSDIDPELKALHEKSLAEADRFWTEVNTTLLPAAARGDEGAVDRSHLRLNDIYERQRAAIESEAKAVQRVIAETEAHSSTVLTVVISLLAVLAIALVGMLVFGVRFMMRQALDPLATTAATMERMASGDLEAGRTNEHRDDEIGQLTRTIEVFREAALVQREAETRQRLVVESISTGLKSLAEGDLVSRIETPLAPEYEALRNTFNETVERLASLMRRVSSSASSVATGAGEIRAASDDLAIRNEQQAASLEETAAAMNQVTSIVKDTAKGAGDVQRSISEAHSEASEGGAVVQRAVAAMAEIERSSAEISQIINVIDGIAFQTNLLALNAGVEAARAGDAGKGFAVVANEVRALAQRSADAARDIKDLITASTEQVSGGVKLVGETGELLSKIVTRVGEINDLVADIAKSTESQASSLHQVNGSVSEMDRMTQQNAAMVEQSTAAARSLADEARELTNLVSQFRTGDEATVTPFRGSRASGRSSSQSLPPVSGNLALAEAPSDDDWTEF